GAGSTSRARDRRVGLRRPRARSDRPGRDRGQVARRHHGLLRRGDARMRVGSNPRSGDEAVNMRRPATWLREDPHMASQRPSTRAPLVCWRTALSVPLLILVTIGSAAAYEVVLSTQGEYMDGYLVNGKAFPPRVIVNDPDPHPPDSRTVPPYIGGRHLNGKVCFFPSRERRQRRQYIVADDEYREACLDPTPPQARCSVTNRRSRFYVGKSLDGWAVFGANGRWTRQHVNVQGEPAVDQNNDPQGAKDPQGCAFLPDGRLLATDVGSEIIGVNDGALLVFFPGGPHGGHGSYCFLDHG